MLKITLLGAGSGFTQPLFTDILSITDLEPRGVIGLVDIDTRRLGVNVKLLKRIVELKKKPGWRIEASADRTAVLPGSDYVINTIEVSGTQTVTDDYEIPLRYGIDQCIGDTIGPGGIMKALRTVPAWIAILKDVETLCPHAMVLNYTNPMSIMTLAALRTVSVPVVGLCHSVQHTSKALARCAQVPYDELVYDCGGINHMAWFTKLTHKGKSIYPRLLKAMADKKVYNQDPVRFDMMKEFGYFVTESSGHFSEYVPYYRTSKKLIRTYCRKKYRGESGFYSKNWPQWRINTDNNRREMATGKREIPLERSHEYAADIIEATRYGRHTTIYGSVANTGLIPNLPQTGVVEVAVSCDMRGFSPHYFGPLPEQCAALCRSNMAVFELAAQGILTGDREAMIHAFMVDPLSSAVCAPAQIREMADTLLQRQKRYIPSWCSKRR